jgi:hypothetical protein
VNTFASLFHVRFPRDLCGVKELARRTRGVIPRVVECLPGGSYRSQKNERGIFRGATESKCLATESRSVECSRRSYIS